MTNKSVYELPTITKIGSIEAVTQAASTGSATDAIQPIGTPFGDLTFS